MDYKTLKKQLETLIIEKEKYLKVLKSFSLNKTTSGENFNAINSRGYEIDLKQYRKIEKVANGYRLNIEKNTSFDFVDFADLENQIKNEIQNIENNLIELKTKLKTLAARFDQALNKIKKAYDLIHADELAPSIIGVGGFWDLGSAAKYDFSNRKIYKNNLIDEIKSFNNTVLNNKIKKAENIFEKHFFDKKNGEHRRQSIYFLQDNFYYTHTKFYTSLFGKVEKIETLQENNIVEIDLETRLYTFIDLNENKFETLEKKARKLFNNSKDLKGFDFDKEAAAITSSRPHGFYFPNIPQVSCISFLYDQESGEIFPILLKIKD